MQIAQSNVRKITITEMKGLDPISIYLEDFEPRKGKIIISCWDKSWHSYWGGMGDRTISEFFLSCDNHYIAKNLSSISSSINDYEVLGIKIKELTKDGGENDDPEIYEQADSMETDEWECWLRSNSNIMTDLFGDDWWSAQLQ